jgi:hypothetical protein
MPCGVVWFGKFLWILFDHITHDWLSRFSFLSAQIDQLVVLVTRNNLAWAHWNISSVVCICQLHFCPLPSDICFQNPELACCIAVHFFTVVSHNLSKAGMITLFHSNRCCWLL